MSESCQKCHPYRCPAEIKLRSKRERKREGGGGTRKRSRGKRRREKCDIVESLIFLFLSPFFRHYSVPFSPCASKRSVWQIDVDKRRVRKDPRWMFAKLCQWFHCHEPLLPDSSVLKVFAKRGLVNVDVIIVDNMPHRRSAPLLTRRCDPYLVTARSSTSSISLCSSRSALPSSSSIVRLGIVIHDWQRFITVSISRPVLWNWIGRYENPICYKFAYELDNK